MGPRRDSAAIPWVAAILLGLTATSSAEPLTCRRAVSAGAAALTQAVLTRVARCETHALAGGDPAGQCLKSAKVAARIAAGRQHLARTVARACGGADHQCGTTDDEPLAALGWAGETCPGADTDPSCPATVANCGDVAGCVACRAVAGAEGLVPYYGATHDRGLAAPPCTRAVARETARFLAKEVKALGTCWDQRLRGKQTSDCPGEKKTSAVIAAARTRQQAAVCRACGGADHRCDGVDDVDPAAVAFPQGCPAIPSTDGGSCAAPITDVADLLKCTDCLAETQTTCAAALAGGGPGAYSAACQPSACCAPTRMVLVAEDGTRFTYGTLNITDVPAGAQLTLDVGPGDAECRHTVVVPPDGFTHPTFCVRGPGVTLSAALVAPGCPTGGALGRGTLWDGHAGPVDADMLITGDTSDGVCSPIGEECKTTGTGAGADVLGGLAIRSGDGVVDPPGVGLQLEVPVHILTWDTSLPGCPEPGGPPADDDGVNREFEIMRFTTARAHAEFADLNQDTCSVAGAYYFAPAEVRGSPGEGPCCAVGQHFELVAAGPVFPGSLPFDVTLTASLPLRVVACEPWPGPGATCDAVIGGGRVATKLTPRNDEGLALVRQPDGKLTLAGVSQLFPDPSAYGVARYLEDGRLDRSFGPDHTGKVVIPITPGRRNQMGLALTPDGKVVLAGGAGLESGPFESVIIRLNADGTLDGSFGTGGIVRSTFGSVQSYAVGVTVAADGKILAGISSCDGNNTCSGVVARLLDDGTLDPSFGTAGLALAIPDAVIYDLHVAGDGTITAGGYGNVLGQRHLNVISRLNASGVRDLTFGTQDGLAAFKGGDGPIGGMVVLDDGSVVASGTQGDDGAQNNAVVARFSALGQPDPSFGQGGIVVTDLGTSGSATALVVRPDGSIVTAGHGVRPGIPVYDADFLLLAFDAGGHLEPGFGTSGVVRTDFGGKVDGAHALVLAPDGTLVAGGGYRAETFSAAGDFALARYRPDGTLDPTFNGECPWR